MDGVDSRQISHHLAQTRSIRVHFTISSGLGTPTPAPDYRLRLFQLSHIPNQRANQSGCGKNVHAGKYPIRIPRPIPYHIQRLNPIYT